MQTSDFVKAWREEIVVPTYRVGRPDRNPMFLEKRVYQGSSGAVYPWPVTDEIATSATPDPWEAVFLENEYLKIMLLPQLGGRVQMALDKTNDYHFVYYNRVIKPALVGLAGPWISGGIEFNWPQHHRPSTFSPVDCDIEHHSDGSATVWMHEIDRMHGTRATHGVRLRPGRAVLEVDVRLNNRTPMPQTFLWWANPAVHVDEHHQSVFPPDVHAVMDHGKRAVSDFPIARGTYYKVDYSPGTDISRYRNIPVPTSYMAYHSDYDFVGSYDQQQDAGLLHVADHHVSPGKKQWTWGCGDFGECWNRQLTDNDGPYIELMCGVYTDNQPDFSWLSPGEEKRFTQNFMPYKGVGMVKNATTDAAIGYKVKGRKLVVTACAFETFPDAQLHVMSRTESVGRQTASLSPETPWHARFDLPAGHSESDLTIELTSSDGRTLVDCSADRDKDTPLPEPAQAIDAPGTFESIEALVLAGRHLEQYRHATREPADYYTEAIRREPENLGANLAMGQLWLRRGRFGKAEAHLRIAVGAATRHNPNPASGAVYYYLGLCLVLQGEYDGAYTSFAKSVWNADYRPAARFQMARLICRRGDFRAAIGLLDEVLVENSRHRQAQHLRVTLLYVLGRQDEAASYATDVVSDDPFNFGTLFEVATHTGDWATFDRRARDELNNFLETALDYAAAGLYDQGVQVLTRARQRGVASPLVGYYLADFLLHLDRPQEAHESSADAQAISLDYCFPNKPAELGILQRAEAADASDWRPAYLQGLWWYDRRQAELAIECWERARDLEPSYPTTWRNLGLAYFNKCRDAQAAWQAYVKALELDPHDARVLFELDQLAKRLGHTPQHRLDRLEQHRTLVNSRDDLTIEYVSLLNLLSHPGAALKVLISRPFRPWEGGEGKAPYQYVQACLMLAQRALAAGDLVRALETIELASQWPKSLGEGGLPGPPDAETNYWRGVALLRLGRTEKAGEAFALASQGSSEVASPMFYNDRPPEQVFYKGLALAALENPDKARACFECLVSYGQDHMDDDVQIDYFAVSLPDFLVFDDNLGCRNPEHCEYVQGLGQLGLAELRRADRRVAVDHFRRVLDQAPHHLGATIHHQLARQANPLAADVPSNRV